MNLSLRLAKLPNCIDGLKIAFVIAFQRGFAKSALRVHRDIHEDREEESDEFYRWLVSHALHDPVR